MIAMTYATKSQSSFPSRKFQSAQLSLANKQNVAVFCDWNVVGSGARPWLPPLKGKKYRWREKTRDNERLTGSTAS